MSTKLVDVSGSVKGESEAGLVIPIFKPVFTAACGLNTHTHTLATKPFPWIS